MPAGIPWALILVSACWLVEGLARFCPWFQGPALAPATLGVIWAAVVDALPAVPLMLLAAGLRRPAGTRPGSRPAPPPSAGGGR